MNKEKQQIEEIAKVITSVPPIEFPIGSRMQGRHIYTATKIAEHLYNADYRKQEWISVEDRLPETYDECLLLRDDEEIIIGWYHASAMEFVEGGIVVIPKVTHWMPLPEAPKMKGGAE